MKDFIIQLYLTGQDSFASNLNWIKEVTGKLFCPHCHNIYEWIRQVDVVVKSKGRKTDIDLIAINCNSVQLFSTNLIQVVGSNLIERSASTGKLIDIAGFEHIRYRTVVAKDDFIVVRGSIESSVKLCVECGRLLYWPIGQKYVLKRDLPNYPFFVSDGQTFCTSKFFREKIEPAKLFRVGACKIPVYDKPIDGLPLELDALKVYLKQSCKLE